MGVAIAWTAFDHSVGCRLLAIESYKGLAVGVEALYRCVYGIEGIMVAAFAVFSLMIYSGTLYLHLSSGEVALEVFHVGGGVPQAPFGKRE